MEEIRINFPILLAATFIPLVVGFIWYHKKVFGSAWMHAAGVTEESAKNANMGLIFGLTILFSFFIAFMIQSYVVHQFSVLGVLSQQPDFNTAGSESSTMLKRFMELYGHSYRTFGHGAFHGALAGLFFAIPILGINSLFERKGFKYIAINGGYWIVSLALMGGVICAFP